MLRIVIVSNDAKLLINYRGEMIKAFVEQGHQVIALAPEKGFEKELATIGAQYRSIPLQRTGINPLKDLYTLWVMVGVLKELKPEAVFSYTIKPVIYASLAARAAKIPKVYAMISGLGYVFVGGSLKQRILLRVVQFLYKQAMCNNSKIFFQNPDDREAFKALNILASEKQSVLINGSGVDIDRFAYVKPKTKPLVFLLIARLIWDKGIGEYVEAARLIKKRHPDVVFKILGPFDSNPAAISSEQMESWVEEGLIEYLGETNDVCPYIAASSVYVLPSFYREGTPRSVLEAMSMGRAVITTDAPGCRETVRHGENGFLVPVKDSRALAEAMERFILKPELIFDMGVKSREIAVEKYDVHKVNRVIMQAMGLIGEG